MGLSRAVWLIKIPVKWFVNHSVYFMPVNKNNKKCKFFTWLTRQNEHTPISPSVFPEQFLPFPTTLKPELFHYINWDRKGIFFSQFSVVLVYLIFIPHSFTTLANTSWPLSLENGLLCQLAVTLFYPWSITQEFHRISFLVEFNHLLPLGSLKKVWNCFLKLQEFPLESRESHPFSEA